MLETLGMHAHLSHTRTLISATYYELRYAMNFDDLIDSFAAQIRITQAMVRAGGSNLDSPRPAGQGEVFTISLPSIRE